MLLFVARCQGLLKIPLSLSKSTYHSQGNYHIVGRPTHTILLKFSTSGSKISGNSPLQATSIIVCEAAAPHARPIPSLLERGVRI